ncbi:SDR family NAD(P)-dependent oxidoreductase [Paenibacillus aceris]|uniref:NAD(P)-dependent dehydrogenase (Short-subunit alcohol dehydrogenase family) n=1 Tax=Paenibacillus aceris TaxID=869555 RepID=A0ABS4HWW5_9BACL|nr:SDR family oxidoreductase [Paenibacillus aceris]MBP1963130.1 NAD(P)-dependent dehydrogenase (short-subunit alcohol dehydrogenase family) [Paenibacillus aceris]
MRLQGKTAIVTGGANGIGKATVQKFLEEGANVVFTDINEQAGNQTCEELKVINSNVIFVKHDVQQETDWAHVVSTAKEKFGRVDVLFNNAGIYSTKPVTDYTVDEWNRVLGINVVGVFLGMKHVVPEMRSNRSGSIINASSIAGITGSANHTLYGASKGAVRIMTKDMAMEVAADQIRVNSIHPGVIQTTMGDAVASGLNVSAEQLASGIPLKRCGTPDDIANLVVFLASDESTFITGTEMIIDGGASAR